LGYLGMTETGTPLIHRLEPLRSTAPAGGVFTGC
jgi:hypothetical protein